MNIVVPLAGKDKSFEEKFALPKPLVQVQGKPIIQHIAESRPFSYADAIFILLREHQEKYGIEEKLRALFGKRIKIAWAQELTAGAPQSVLLAKDLINTEEPLLIDLADQYLDLPCFMDFAASSDADGIIPTFESSYWNRGYMEYGSNGRVARVSEKDKPPISTHSTACISYFRRGSDFVHAAQEMVARKKTAANGAYLVSLAFNELIADKRRILPFPCEFVATLGSLEGAAAFPQLAKPLKSAHEIFHSSIRASPVFAHRGIFPKFPENSLPAIQEAIKNGFSSEIDARFSKDGVVVLSHDADTGRLFAKKLCISKCTLKELRSTTHKNSSTKIATLDEALDALASSAICTFAIHLKEIPTQAQARSLAEKIFSRGLENRVFFFGNDDSCMPAINAIKSASPLLHSGWHTTAPQKLAQDWQLANADALWMDESKEGAMNAGALKVSIAQGKPSIAMSPELLDEILKRKARTSAKAAQARWKQLLTAGFDAICTDYPHELAGFLEK